MLTAKQLQELLDIHVSKDAEPFPVRLTYFEINDKQGCLQATYAKDELLVRNKLIIPKLKDSEWTITISSSLIQGIQSLKPEMNVSLKFKKDTGSLTVSADKNQIALTPWKSDKILEEVEENFNDPLVILHFDKDGFAALASCAVIARENPKGSKKPMKGIHIQYAGSIICLTSLNDTTMVYRTYQMPTVKKGRGRPSSKGAEVKSGEFTIPAEAISLLERGGEESVSISISRGKALLEGVRVTITADLIEVKRFPTIEDFNPTDSPKIEFDRNKLLKAVTSLIGEDLNNTPIQVIFKNSSLTLHVEDKKDITVPVAQKPEQPLQSSVMVAGKALLNVLKYVTAAQVALAFPGIASERLVVEAIGASYLLSATIVEAVKTAKEKIAQMTSPAPAAETVDEQIQSDGSTVVTEKVEAPQPKLGEEPKPETQAEAKAELEKEIKKAKEISSEAQKAAQKESPETKEFIKKATEVHLALIKEAEENLKKGEKLDILLSSLFWSNNRLYSWTVSKTSFWRLKINIDIVEEDED